MAAGPADAGPVLSPEHLRQLSAARRGGLGRKVRRTVSTARLSGWTTGAFGGLTVAVCLLSFSAPALLLGLALLASGWFELHYASALSRLDARAPRRLAINQLALGGAIIVYSLWGMYAAATSHSPLGAELAGSPELDELVGSAAGMARMLSVGVYAGVIVASVCFQGGLAWYYAVRGRALRAYLAETPAWVVALDRAGG